MNTGSVLKIQPSIFTMTTLTIYVTHWHDVTEWWRRTETYSVECLVLFLSTQPFALYRYTNRLYIQFLIIIFLFADDYVTLSLIVRTDEGRLCESIKHASSVIVSLQNKTNKNVETSYIH
jgi:hypothetical protein